MKTMNTLRTLYAHELRELADAESQLIRMLPLMASAATDERLKEQFRSHERQSRVHRNRLQILLKDAEGRTDGGVLCEGMRGILREAERFMEPDGANDAVRDAALLGIAQKAEHYEMASYGTVRTHAATLGERDAQKILQQTLDEEGHADEQLSFVAEKTVNPEATL